MIAWARKLTHSVTFWWLLVGLLIGSLFLVKPTPPDTAVIKGQRFTVERVETEEQRQKGLSGRDSIGANNVMIFVYHSEGKRCMWMKDMKFAIDMVWLDESQRIIAIEHDVKPDTYPKDFCVDNARYVMEFAAGTAKRLGLSTETVQL